MLNDLIHSPDLRNSAQPRHHRPDHALPPLLLTPDQVARQLGISRASVYRLVEQRRLPFHRVLRSLRFSREDLAAYLAKHRVGSVDDNTP